MAQQRAEQKNITADLLVVGAGHAGLSMACAAAAGGLSVCIVDREAPSVHLDAGFDGRVFAIAYGSRRILEQIGVWPGLAEGAQPILDIRVSDGDSPLFLHYDHRDIGAEPLGHIVESRALRAALTATVQMSERITWRAPAEIAGLERGDHGVLARFGDDRTVRARLVVACDGKNSGLRADAGIGVMRWSYDQCGIVCTIAHERPHRGVAHERFLPAGPFAILPITGNRSSLVWTERSDLAPALVALDEKDFLAEVSRRFGDFMGGLSLVGPRWSYPLTLTVAKELTAARLVLVGDAAQAIHPIAGQGYNLGLRDVAALAEVLVDGARLGLDIGAADSLARYARWRHVDRLSMTAVTDGLNRLFSNDITPVRLARDIGLATVNKLPPLKRLFMRHAMGAVGTLPRLAQGLPL